MIPLNTFFKIKTFLFVLKRIGTWDSTSSFLNLTHIVHWPNNMAVDPDSLIPESVCSKPCKPGKQGCYICTQIHFAKTFFFFLFTKSGHAKV